MDVVVDWCCYWFFDGDGVFFQCIEGFFWELFVWIVNVGGFFIGENFYLVNFFGVVVGFGYSGVDNFDYDWGNVDVDIVVFDKGNDWIIWGGLFGNDFLIILWNCDVRCYIYFMCCYWMIWVLC